MTLPVAAVMSAGGPAVEPQETLRRAALLLAEAGADALPVCSGGRLLGIVVQRDLADAAAPDATCVSDVMSLPAVSCRATDDTADALRLMAAHGLRSLPVTAADGTLIGSVALADAESIALSRDPA